jgi:hypothetical protein
MKGVLSTLVAFVGFALVLAVGAAGYHWLTYYSGYNALLREIQRHPSLQIVDHWRHEDMTLEDFGFAVRSARATAFVDIVDGSSIRRPDDRAKGIAFHLRGETHREGNAFMAIRRFIEFDGVDWQQRGLPKVRSIAELLPHFDVIVHSLFTSPPLTSTSGPLPDFISLGTANDRQRSKSPPVPLSKL